MQMLWQRLLLTTIEISRLQFTKVMNLTNLRDAAIAEKASTYLSAQIGRQAEIVCHKIHVHGKD